MLKLTKPYIWTILKAKADISIASSGILPKSVSWWMIVVILKMLLFWARHYFGFPEIMITILCQAKGVSLIL